MAYRKDKQTFMFCKYQIKSFFSSPLNYVDRVIKMFDAGFIDLREAIREINPDDSEAQIDDKLIKAQTRQNELNSQVESNINGLGDFNV